VYKNPEFDDLAPFAGLAASIETLVIRANGFTSLKLDLQAFTSLQLLDISETPALKKFEFVGNKPATLTTIFINGGGLEVLSKTTWEQLILAEFVDLGKNTKLSCDCDHLPDNFVSEENERRFQGSVCGSPASTQGKPFGSVCEYSNYFLKFKSGESRVSSIYNNNA